MEDSTLKLRTLYPVFIFMAIRYNFNWAHLNIVVNSLITSEKIFLIHELVISNMPAIHDNFPVMIIITDYVMHKGKHLKGSGRLNLCPQHLFQY